MVITKGAKSQNQSERPSRATAAMASRKRTNPVISVALATTIGGRVIYEITHGLAVELPSLKAPFGAPQPGGRGAYDPTSPHVMRGAFSLMSSPLASSRSPITGE